MLRLLASGFGVAAAVATTACLLLLPLGAFAAGTVSEQIIVDQFGWRADAPRKVAIFSDPIDGQNSAVSYTPGASFQLRRVSDEAIIFTGSTVAWNSGATDTTSGDKVWHGDFSSVTTPGEYYIYDPANDLRSFAFKLDNAVFNDVLKASIRMYYYQRTGTSIPAQHAGNWSRGLTHIGPGQDNEALLWEGNAAVPGTQRDVSGGWFDAGDFNKYAPWASGLLWDLLASYEWNPTAFGDAYNIPESGNGVPDALDEFKWCLDWLLKMQLANGSVLNRVGDGPGGGRYYTPATTWSTASFASAMAHASRVYAPFDSVYPGYSTTLLNAATGAWNYLSVTPGMTPSSGSDGANGIAVASAGCSAEEDFRQRVLAAAELWKTTANATYKTYFETNYKAPGSYSGTAHPLAGGWPHLEATAFMELNRAFVTYAMTPGANPTIVGEIKGALSNMISNIAGDYNSNGGHAYRSYVWDYFWGSNGVKSQWANLLTFAIKLNVGTEAQRTQYREIAEEYLHYIHGRNPLSMVYLSNMGTKGANIGGEKSAMELWHGSFLSAQYDGINSTYGPAPGFLVGGPNRHYSVTTVSPPYGQPPSKSYKDWNTGWPESSWEITEPSIGYQSGYCLMLSQFAVTPDTAPSDLAASAVSSSQINLTWADNSSDEDSFELQQATNSTFSSGLVTTTLGANVTSATATGLANNTTYYFRVRAINSSATYSNTASATPSDRRALYAFEGNAQDSSGSGNHGTATALSYVAGKVGTQAAQFNGSGGSVTIPPSVTDDFTVAMWVKTTDIAGTADAQWWAGKGLVDGEVGGGGADWGTALVNGKFVLGVGSTGGDTTLASSVNINDGGWHHVAATRSNTSGATAVFVDGVLRGSGTGPTGSRTFPPSLRIGSLQTGNNFLNGSIDDVRLYDRVLSASEVAALARSPYGGTPWAVPGVIQAEDYDIGSQGFAYNDTDIANNGGQYRSEGVDLETCTEGGYNVGWVGAGEWLEYTVNVAYTGSYDITLRAASMSSQIQGHVEFDGVDATGLMTAPVTGGWQTYTDVTAPDVILTAGQHVMRVYFDGGAWNLNHVTTTANSLPAPQNLTATSGAAQISLSWNTVNGATGYTIQRAPNIGGPFTELAAGVTTTTHVDSGLSDGTTWHYTVAAHGLPGAGAPSAPVSAATYTALENWRSENFGTTANTGNAADSADPDGDGWTNEQEFISGTNPNSASSLLKIDPMQASGNNMDLTFPSVLNRTYRVERSATMLDSSWITVQDNIPGTGGPIQVTDTGGSGHERRFYRIVVW